MGQLFTGSISIRGMRGPIPSGYVVGRTDSGSGPPHLISWAGIGQKLMTSGVPVTRLSSLQDVAFSTLTNKQHLEYNATAGKWVNVAAPALATLTDVDTTGLLTGQGLQYNGTKWVPHTRLLSEDGDVAISSPANLQVLQYNSGTGKWANATVSVSATLAGLTDVAITSPADGDIIQYNAATSKWKNITASALGVTITIFTAGGTWTPIANLGFAIIECQAGGGGGGGTQGNASFILWGGGGGAGGFSRATKTKAQVGASQTVTIGAAGAAGIAASGGNGGDTSVGTLCIAKGGGAGGFCSSGAFGIGGAGGVPGTGDEAAPGANGIAGFYQSPVVTMIAGFGLGASSQWGEGGAGAVAVSTGTGTGSNATGFGAGGGGAASNGNAGNANGGTGSPGRVVIYEYAGPLVIGGGSSTLAGDTDVLITSPANNDLLTFDLASGKWKNKPASSSGVKAAFGAAEFNAHAGSSFGAGNFGGRSIFVRAGTVITGIQFYAVTASGTTQIAPSIYADSAGSLGAQQAVGPTVTGVVQGINTLALTTPYTAAADVVIWIGFVAITAAVNMATAASITQQVFFSQLTLPPPATPGAGTYASGVAWGSMWGVGTAPPA